jgi:hypothetical protein
MRRHGYTYFQVGEDSGMMSDIGILQVQFPECWLSFDKQRTVLQQILPFGIFGLGVVGLFHGWRGKPKEMTGNRTSTRRIEETSIKKNNIMSRNKQAMV